MLKRAEADSALRVPHSNGSSFRITPTGLRIPALGSDARPFCVATLGYRPAALPNPESGCVISLAASGLTLSFFV
jgi:hypothetical protein